MDSDFMKMQGELVKKRRTQLELTQEELAKKLGYKSKSSINKIEIGEKSIPQKKIQLMASALSVPVGYLYGYQSGSPWVTAFACSYEECKSGIDTADLYTVVDAERISEWEDSIYNHVITLDTACDIADTFGCSLDTMTGLSKDIAPSHVQSEWLSEDENKLLTYFQQLNREGQKQALSLLKTFTRDEDYQQDTSFAVG